MRTLAPAIVLLLIAVAAAFWLGLELGQRQARSELHRQHVETELLTALLQAEQPLAAAARLRSLIDTGAVADPQGRLQRPLNRIEAQGRVRAQLWRDLLGAPRRGTLGALEPVPAAASQ